MPPRLPRAQRPRAARGALERALAARLARALQGRESEGTAGTSVLRLGSMESLCAANSTFAVELLRKLCEKKSGQNVFFSPFSISSALSMVLLGSRGSTEGQISKVLSLKNAQDAHNGYQSLLSEINDPNTKYILRTANRLYGEKTFEFLPSFIESSQKSYHAGLEQMDFLHAWEDARKQINGWVKERTEGKIQNLLAEGILDSLTRLVLVNAIYFKGNWEKPFRKASTRERPFHINKNETRPVQMMFKEANFNMTYIGDFQTKILELPYVGNELSMIILLPDAIQDGSTGLERSDSPCCVSAAQAVCCSLGQRLWKKSWPCSGAEVSCGCGEGTVW
ncbi:leukocyte elastase inhibitor-like isoform X3 [Passer domesticus]|uniref:leukocyte elastase inhibitor-like isoform X3 n=1 Tax=Passer domesticus TaxID=48849 RepID=UPI0030FEFC69